MSACFCVSLACAQLRPTASRVMRSKSKWGSTFCSASSTTLEVLPDCRSLSALMIASTSSLTRLTIASGASSAAARAGRAKAISIRMKRSMETFPRWGTGRGFDLNAPTGFPVDSLLRGAVVLGLAEKELPAEPLEDDRRLGDGDAVARLQFLVVAARL